MGEWASQDVHNSKAGQPPVLVGQRLRQGPRWQMAAGRDLFKVKVAFRVFFRVCDAKLSAALAAFFAVRKRLTM